MTTLAPRTAPALLAALLLAAQGAAAQPIYRIVGPDGRVTFSDRPPANAQQVQTLSKDGRARADTEPAAGNAELPFELRQIVQRYPVTLYSGDNCEPCALARNLLSSRGIPYQERTVRSNADIEMLQRIAGDASVPVLTIGAQRLKGFAPADWNSYLDAAGYPAHSRLPAGWRNPPPMPLAPAPPAEAAPAEPPAPAQPEAAPALPPPAPPPAPSGIVF
jgi:glutaredoxin